MQEVEDGLKGRGIRKHTEKVMQTKQEVKDCLGGRTLDPPE